VFVFPGNLRRLGDLSAFLVLYIDLLTVGPHHPSRTLRATLTENISKTRDQRREANADAVAKTRAPFGLVAGAFIGRS
jgi:hypothetical protein